MHHLSGYSSWEEPWLVSIWASSEWSTWWLCSIETSRCISVATFFPCLALQDVAASRFCKWIQKLCGMWTTSATWNNLRLYFCDAVFVLHFTSSVAVLPGRFIFVFCNNGGLSFFWLFRPATIQSSSPFSCRAWMPSIHISQVLYVWELKFMHLSRTWECIVIPLSRLLHYTLFNSQCKPMYTYIFIQTSCSQNLFFWGFWQLSPCCGDFTKVGCVELETVGRGESEISSCRMRTDTLLLMRSNKSWTTWKNPCDSELMTVTAFYFDAYVVLKCLNA